MKRHGTLSLCSFEETRTSGDDIRHKPPPITRPRSPSEMRFSSLLNFLHPPYNTSRNARQTTHTRPHATTSPHLPFAQSDCHHKICRRFSENRETEETEKKPIPAYPAQMLDTSLRFGASIGEERGIKEIPQGVFLQLPIFAFHTVKEAAKRDSSTGRFAAQK